METFFNLRNRMGFMTVPLCVPFKWLLGLREGSYMFFLMEIQIVLPGFHANRSPNTAKAVGHGKEFNQPPGTPVPLKKTFGDKGDSQTLGPHILGDSLRAAG